MDSSGNERKRALSLSGLSSVGNKLSIGLGSEADHNNFPRIRHPSFALTTDRPGILDDLIDAAFNRIRDESSTEVSQIKEPLSAHIIAALEDTEFSTDSRKTSSATIVAQDVVCPTLSSEAGLDPSVGIRDSFAHNPKKIKNADSLSSTVLKLYLSQLPTSNSKENYGKTVITPLISNTPRISEPPQDRYIPECFQIHAPSVASMTMPVNQVTRAYSRFYGNSSLLTRNVPTVTVQPLGERNILTDANYSSGLSDTDSRCSPKSHGKSTCGYQSDHYMLEAASEARKLRMTGRRLELDFHRSTASLSSTERHRAYSGNSTPVTKRRLSTSARNSKIDLTQVYDGLLPPKTPTSPSPSSEWSVSNGSLDVNSRLRFIPPNVKSGLLTPPGSPISTEAFGRTRSTSTEHCNANPSTLDRLRSMLTNFKHTLGDNEENKYFYMDEESLERRAKAQASNVIAPVSF